VIGAEPLTLRGTAKIARAARGDEHGAGWGDQGRRSGTRDPLVPIHSRFTEGFDTPDLKGVKAFPIE